MNKRKRAALATPPYAQRQGMESCPQKGFMLCLLVGQAQPPTPLLFLLSLAGCWVKLELTG